MNPGIAPESPDLVWFGGEDAERFLNDLISQEIATLEPGRSVRSLLLSPQGKIDHVLWVVRGDERFGLITEPGRGADLAATLGRYRIRVDVEIAESSEPVWVIVGEAPADVQGFDISWANVGRTAVIGERPGLPDIDPAQYERLRIAAGEPRFGIDVDEKTIPQEVGGLVDAAVDFDKGCYLGQELVARIAARGDNVPRHLRVIRLESAGLSTGAELRDGDRVVGTLTSVSGDLGLALVHREVSPGDSLTAEGSPATVLNH